MREEQSPHDPPPILAQAGEAGRARALQLLKTHGVRSNSFQILETGYTYWFHSHSTGESVIAYVPVRNYCVVPGGPVGPLEATREAISDFHTFAKAQGRRVMFVGAESSLLEALGDDRDAYEAIKLGEQPEWNPEHFSIEGPERRSLRAQINRATNKGVRIRRVGAEDLERSRGSSRLAIEHILGRWLASRRVGVLRFMVDLEPFSFAGERRYYVAEHGDELVGFLSAVPIYERRGWFFEDVIRVPTAPNGTTEALIYEAMEHAKACGDTFVTLGLAPLTGIERGPGEHRAMRWGLRFLAKHFGSLYGFEGLRRFKSRFNPDLWTPQYAIIPRGSSRLAATWALFSAFVPGSMATFLYDSFRRLLGRISGKTWAACLVVQLACLVPWTVLLAMIDGQHWFGDRSTQVAWVAFDSTMALGLSSLAYMLWRDHAWARRVSMFLAGATLTDFVLSLVQGIELHSAVSGWSLLFVLMGVLGPAVATLFLWCIAISRRGESS